jgi:hypothetical protein
MISKNEFLKIRELKEDEFTSKILKKDDKFLYGTKMCDQKEKNDGDDVTYFKVLEIKENGNILYTAITEKIGEE